MFVGVKVTDALGRWSCLTLILSHSNGDKISHSVQSPSATLILRCAAAVPENEPLLLTLFVLSLALVGSFG